MSEALLTPVYWWWEQLCMERCGFGDREYSWSKTTTLAGLVSQLLGMDHLYQQTKKMLFEVSVAWWQEGWPIDLIQFFHPHEMPRKNPTPDALDRNTSWCQRWELISYSDCGLSSELDEGAKQRGLTLLYWWGNSPFSSPWLYARLDDSALPHSNPTNRFLR